SFRGRDIVPGRSTQLLGVMNTSARATNTLATLWALGGAVILVAAFLEHVELLQGPESFRLSEGPEQSVLIFEIIGILALVEGGLRANQLNGLFWPRRIMTVLILLNSAV